MTLEVVSSEFRVLVGWKMEGVLVVVDVWTGEAFFGIIALTDEIIESKFLILESSDRIVESKFLVVTLFFRVGALKY